MRTIVVLNPKGGCGKSTIATNIAAYFSIKGKRVTLADCDPCLLYTSDAADE